MQQPVPAHFSSSAKILRKTEEKGRRKVRDGSSLLLIPIAITIIIVVIIDTTVIKRCYWNMRTV